MSQRFICPAHRPVIPDCVSRVEFRTGTCHGDAVTDSVDLARAWLTTRPWHWNLPVTGDQNADGIIITTDPVTCLHAEYNWSLWTDDQLVRDAAWIGGRQQLPQHPVPRSLPAAAVTGLTIVARAFFHLDAQVWRPLVEAVGHVETQIDQDEDPALEEFARLVHHEFTTPSGPVSLWESERGNLGERTGFEFLLYLEEKTARRAFTAAKLL